MTFFSLRVTALESWKAITDPCTGGQFLEVNHGIAAPLYWQLWSYPVSCQWQIKAGKLGFGHISIFCSLWDWAANLTDTLLDFRFDDYPVGEPEGDVVQTSDISAFLDQTPEVLSRHYFRTLLLAAEILEDLTFLLEVISGSGAVKKKLRFELSGGALSADALIKYVNKICKHKIKLHECNHHIPKRFLDSAEKFNPEHYVNWEFLSEERIEIPRYSDIIDTIVGAFKKIDELLDDPENMSRVGHRFGKAKITTAIVSPLSDESNDFPA